MLLSLMLVKSYGIATLWINPYHFLQGYNEKNAYIACQGPMKPTVADFWRMVWEKCVNTIVMITNLNEEGKVKIISGHSMVCVCV